MTCTCVKADSMAGTIPVDYARFIEMESRAGCTEHWLPLSPFYKAIAAIIEVHERKSADYGTDGDEHANVRATERFGIPGWLGAVIRGEDKTQRIQAWCQNHRLANEGLTDTLLDRATYAVIALALWLESIEKEEQGKA